MVVEVSDYQAVLETLEANAGATTLALRKHLAQKAYARTAAYDAAISGWFARQNNETAPDWAALGGRLQQSLRYGENPHQSAAFYEATRLAGFDIDEALNFFGAPPPGPAPNMTPMSPIDAQALFLRRFEALQGEIDRAR